MRKPYPFRVPVDTETEDVAIKVMVDMPDPLNLTVHFANEHGQEAPDQHSRVVLHMLAHTYGESRPGCEHYHTRGEYA